MTSHFLSHHSRVRQFSVLTGAALLTLFMAVETPAGIQGSGFRSMIAVGTVTSMSTGSISVGGPSYSTAGASVDIDGKPGSPGQLRLGDVVALSGSDDGGQTPAAVNRISFSGNVRGPVSSVDVANGTFIVLGQTVRTTSQTIFSGPLKLTALVGIVLGEVVEVSGFDNSDGEIVASRIDSKTTASPLRVTGHVHSLNPTQSTFSINSLVVDFSSAHVQGTLTEGVMVTVQAPASGPSAVFRTTDVTVQLPVAAQPGTEGRIEGIITDLPSSQYFEINGLAVSINSQTQINGNVHLSLNAPVRVTGYFDSNGVLVADHVQAGHSEAAAASKGSR